MVEDETTDGTRIAQLLSSEIHGHERGSLGGLSVVDADPDVDPEEFGAFAYGVAFETDDEPRRIVEVYVHSDRARVEFLAGVQTAAEVADREGLRVRPKAVDPPRTLVFVESGAEVKRALRVVRAVADQLREDGR
ncbi:hypothetical protein KY092_14890 [Natronomonas gomsonensis]|jgi:hypothetical protein|uniref:hypothetical protein n=1 Tax=Natronomonas gomsonensis TaxID=1046043 RepID=UPI0020CA27D5|nr:hypothetical protein [Natronomonas gomsonensis]MCY4731844.1 hypothetical protein [Natronomonas gomsonensis]